MSLSFHFYLAVIRSIVFNVMYLETYLPCILIKCRDAISLSGEVCDRPDIRFDSVRCGCVHNHQNKEILTEILTCILTIPNPDTYSYSGEPLRLN